MTNSPRYWKCPHCEEVFMMEEGFLPDLTFCEECELEVSPKENEMDELDFWSYCNDLKNGY